MEVGQRRCIFCDSTALREVDDKSRPPIAFWPRTIYHKKFICMDCRKEYPKETEVEEPSPTLEGGEGAPPGPGLPAEPIRIVDDAINTIDMFYNGDLPDPEEGYLDLEKKIDDFKGFIENIETTNIDPSEIKELNLNNNKINNLVDITCFSNLKSLYLSKNHFTDINSEYLPESLEELDLSENKLEQIPNLKDTRLVELDFSKNKISTFEAGSLPNTLARLYLGNNELEKLPDNLGDLEALVTFSLYNNKIRSISSIPFQNLLNLNTLDFRENPVEEIKDLHELTPLEILRISDECLKDELIYLSQFSHLIKDTFSSDRIKEFTKRVKDFCKYIAIHNELPLIPEPVAPAPVAPTPPAPVAPTPRARPQEFVKLQRLKIFVVGESMVGKTALYRTVSSSMPISKEETIPPTNGIDINNVFTSQGSGTGIQWWDFAGQGSYKAIHKLFLSEGAFYILVLNLRKTFEENKVNYWIHSILEKDQNAVILPILTHLDMVKNSGVLGLNSKDSWRKLMEISKQSNFLPIIKVSNTDYSGIGDVREILQKKLQEVNIRYVPKIYSDIERFILSLKDRLFTTYSELSKLINNEFEGKSNYSPDYILHIIEIMNRDGLITHIRMSTDDDIIILDIKEASKIISKIFDSARADNEGVVAYSEIETIITQSANWKISPNRYFEYVIELLVSLGVAFRYQKYERRRTRDYLLIPYCTRTFTSQDFKDIYGGEFPMSKSSIKIKISSYDEIISARILGILHQYFSLETPEDNVWQLNGGNSLCCLFYNLKKFNIFGRGHNRIQPVFFFRSDRYEGYYIIDIQFFDYNSSKLLYEILLFTLNVWKINYEIEESPFKPEEKEIDNTQIFRDLWSMIGERFSSLEQKLGKTGMNISKEFKEIKKEVILQSGGINNSIKQATQLLINELDKLTNKCPRLVILKPVDRRKGIKGLADLGKDVFSVVLICELCLRDYDLVDDKNKKIEVKQLKDNYKRALSVISKIGKIAQNFIPYINFIIDQMNKLQAFEIPKTSKDSQEKAKLLIKNCKEMIDNQLEDTVSPTPDEMCEFLKIIDPRNYWKDIIEKYETKWICKECASNIMNTEPHTKV